MKQTITTFVFCLFVLLSVGQTNTDIDREMVKTQVAKVVKLLEEKYSKTLTDPDPMNTVSAWIEVTDSGAQGVRTTGLYYYKNGTKDLWLSLKYYDAGANGWGEVCVPGQYVDCDGMPPGVPQQFTNWTLTDRQKYLNEYFCELEYWQAILTYTPAN